MHSNSFSHLIKPFSFWLQCSFHSLTKLANTAQIYLKNWQYIFSHTFTTFCIWYTFPETNFLLFTRKQHPLFKILIKLSQWILLLFREIWAALLWAACSLRVTSHCVAIRSFQVSASLNCELLQDEMEFDVALGHKCLISGKYLAPESIYSMSICSPYRNHLNTTSAAISTVQFNKHLRNTNVCQILWWVGTGVNYTRPWPKKNGRVAQAHSQLILIHSRNTVMHEVLGGHRRGALNPAWGGKKRAWILRLSLPKLPLKLQFLMKWNAFYLTVAVHPHLDN